MIQSIRFRWEFDLLREAGRYRRSGPLGLRHLPGDDARGSTHDVRIAFAIGRSVGGAVVRNRIRRRLREVLGAFDRHGRLEPGRYLFIVSPAAADASFSELEQHLDHLIGRAA